MLLTEINNGRVRCVICSRYHGGVRDGQEIHCLCGTISKAVKELPKNQPLKRRRPVLSVAH